MTQVLRSGTPLSEHPVRTFRKRKRLSLQKAAFLCDIDDSYLSLVETRKRPMTTELAIRLMHGLGPLGLRLQDVLVDME